MSEPSFTPTAAGDAAAPDRQSAPAPQKRTGSRQSLRHIIVPTVAMLAVGGIGVSAFVNAGTQDIAAAAVTPVVSAPTAVVNFADLAAKVSPAVVTITSTHSIDGSGPTPDLPFNVPKGSPLEEFFRHFREQQQGGQPRRVMALGSGFIIDPAGYIATNNHVVEKASDVKVTLSTGTEYPAKVIGIDAKTDLAVLKINAPMPLAAVAFGDSERVRVGDWVMAVGNPFGLGGTVTTGIISARARDLHDGPFDDFLQIDAAINQGNSGGPTFNLAGEVIGINTAIASPNGGSVGIGFAIPSNLAKPVIAQLEAHGTVERGWLGVAMQEVTPEIASVIGLDQPRGALVSRVEPGSPAAKAKLRTGDVILGYNGHPVDRLHELTRLVADTPAGKTAALEVWRDKTKLTLNVEIVEQKPERQAANDAPSPTESTIDGTVVGPLGAALAAITPDVQRALGIPEGVDGVIIIGVSGDGAAADEGLQPGDVIEQVNQKSVHTPEEVNALITAAVEAKQEAVLLLVNHDGQERFVAVKVSRA